MGDREKASDIIINNELLLMQQLNYNLTVHNPFRPVEGLLIDIKVNKMNYKILIIFIIEIYQHKYWNFQTRFPAIENPERLRPHIEEFLEKVFLTDSVLLYAPSQIALAATLHAASTINANLDDYVTRILFSAEYLFAIIEAVRSNVTISFNSKLFKVWV